MGGDGRRVVTACTCKHYVVDYSDPERYHPENVDREDDPLCPIHGVWDGMGLSDAIGRRLSDEGFVPFGLGVPHAATRAACDWMARVVEDLCPHEADQHAEGTCEVCDYAFALSTVLLEESES